jgi:2-polyprenyl-3-methyl-5-hydroxy-6-metoxy-1,4-benzoquinol methylase
MCSPPTCQACSAVNSFRTLHQLSEFQILVCSKCGLYVKNPLPSRSELLEIYNSKEYWMHPYFQSSNTLLAVRGPYRVGLNSLANLHPQRGLLLEVGCGLGAFLLAARRDGWQVQGVELSEQAASYVTQEFSIPVEVGFAEDIQLPARRFTAIALWDVLEHVASPRLLISKLEPALKMDGTILVFTPNAQSLVRQLAPHIGTNKQRARFVQILYPAVHTYYFNPANLRMLLKTSDLQAIECRQMSANPGRAAQGSKYTRSMFRNIDLLGAFIARRYRILALARHMRSLKSEETPVEEA